jgi:hypothetical protein
MFNPTEMTKAWADSLERALAHLWTFHDRGGFYYFVLATTDSLDFPCASAWSEEALLAQSARLGHLPAELRFSYADSPFLDFASPFTAALREEWDRDVERGRTSDDTTHDLLAGRRLSTLVGAMHRLRASGVVHAGLVINVELGQTSDRERARLLNAPSPMLGEYLGSSEEGEA